jgi:putative chitinase
VTSPSFYTVIRASLDHTLSRGQVDGFEALLSASADLPESWRAYLLATAWHETSTTMQPVHEYGSRAYLSKYDTGKLAAALGNTPEADGDGIKYAGRGYVQLTGRRNYDRAGDALDLDLVGNPDLAMNSQVAAHIAIRGMTEGWFTGKAFRHYLPGDYVNARRIINGTDCAEKIAKYARIFETALSA